MNQTTVEAPSRSAGEPLLGRKGLLIDNYYRLLDLLQKGGQGEVWSAEQLVQGERALPNVALKLLQPPRSGAPGAGTPGTPGSGERARSQRWIEEVIAAGEIKCDAIARVFKAGNSEEHGFAFIAMELLEGEDLEARIKLGWPPARPADRADPHWKDPDQPLSWRRALAIARAIAVALVAAHEKGIIHCDLKPRNVFLTKGGRVCVLDFGVAILTGRSRPTGPPVWRPSSVDPDGATAPDRATPPGGWTDPRASMPPESATNPGAGLAGRRARSQPLPLLNLAPSSPPGTPGYIAPERWQETTSFAADLYSLGVVLYRMIAGRLPYRLTPEQRADPSEHARNAAINGAALQGNIEELSVAAPGTPRAVAECVMRLLSMDPCERARPGDPARGVRAVLDDLDEVWSRPYGPPDPPYVGLDSFNERRTGFLAGRDADIRDIVARLRDKSWVLLIGPSGCGKSSLAVAGVAARLDEDFVDGLDGWVVRVVRPERGRAGLDVAEASSASRAPVGVGTVIVVDQFEEVLGLEEEAQTAFCRALCELARRGRNAHVLVNLKWHVEPREPVRIIATVRDDRASKVAGLAALKELFADQNPYLVRGVDANAASAIIEGPARAAGLLTWDAKDATKEAEKLLAADPSVIPLVQFALTEWWERRGEKVTTPEEAWKTIGGIEGSLALAAQKLYDSLEPDEQMKMRDLLVLLFNDDGKTKRPYAEKKVPSGARAVLKRLLEQRLVRAVADTNGEAQLEVAHEALAARWPQLQQDLRDTLAKRRLMDDAANEARSWDRQKRPAYMLWPGPRLEAVRPYVGELDDLAKTFIGAADRKERRGRTWKIGFAVVSVIVTIAIILGFIYEDSTRKIFEAKAREARAESMSAQQERAYNQNLAAANDKLRKINDDLANQQNQLNDTLQQLTEKKDEADRLRAEAVKEQERIKQREARVRAVCGEVF